MSSSSKAVRYQLISAPADNTKALTLQKLKSAIAAPPNDVAEVVALAVPEFKVGTLDTLMQASDELVKADHTIDSIVKRLGDNVKSLLESEAERSARTILLVNDRSVDVYLKNFAWNTVKYRVDKPVKELIETIVQEVGSIEAATRNKLTAFNNLKTTITAYERRQLGNLAVKSLNDIVKKEHFILDSEYMQTQLIAVPKITKDEFLQNYEKLTPMVVPRSAQLLAEDQDFCLYAVVVFKRVLDEFCQKLRENKFTPRDYVFDEQAIAKERKEFADTATAAKEQRAGLLRLCKTNFSEAFQAWIHIKILRVFTESILRYGLPPNFQAMVVKPTKTKSDKVLAALSQHYARLGSSAAKVGKEDVEEAIQGLLLDSDYYPFVRFEVMFDED